MLLWPEVSLWRLCGNGTHESGDWRPHNSGQDGLGRRPRCVQVRAGASFGHDRNAADLEGAVPLTSEPLRKLGFLTIGLFEEADPRRGHESTLEIIELGEQLGFDSAWVRHRHLQFGISSPVAVLAAASQRTSRIQLGTAVIPLGWENPLRLAEDLATVDILSGGRLHPGVSIGPPMQYEHVKEALDPDTADADDFGYERVRRLLALVRGERASDFRGKEGYEAFSDRVQ